MPRSKILRMGLGFGFVTGGLVGFLPVVGFWMVPVGLLILAHDIPAARRMERAMRRWVIRLIRTWRERRRR